MKKYTDVAEKVHAELEILQNQHLDKTKKSEKGIIIISKGLEDLRNKVSKSGFSTEKEEIFFFKTVKPTLMSKLIFNRCVFDIEIKRTFHSEKDIDEFIENKLNYFKKIIEENEEFVKYYQSQNTHLDSLYFKRSIDSFPLFNHNCLLYEDPNFATSKDYVLANILAFKKLQIYLKKKDSSQAISNLIFTGSQYDFVELVYGLHASEIFNNGKINIIDISRTFQQIFNFQVDDIYRIFNEIRSRKISKTKFIVKMQNSLLLKMNTLDN